MVETWSFQVVLSFIITVCSLRIIVQSSLYLSVWNKPTIYWMFKGKLSPRDGVIFVCYLTYRGTYVRSLVSI